MDNKTIVFGGETNYLKTEPFKFLGNLDMYPLETKTDFGTIVSLPGVSGNYFTVKPMKKKNQKQSVRQLKAQVKKLEAVVLELKDASFRQNREFSEVVLERDVNKRLNRELQMRFDNQTKAIGLYFAATGSECSTSEETLAYLRSLRAQIFQ